MEGAGARLLWVDLRQIRNDSVVEKLDEKFVFTITRQICEIRCRIAVWQPGLIIFEYDFPDIPRLRALQQTKIDHPHLPILMLTEYHSESLAVWSFRSGARDYVVKPVDETDLTLICIRLLTVVNANKSKKCRENFMPQPRLPHDVRIYSKPTADEVLAKALEYLSSHFHEKITLDCVASLCDLTRFEFSRQFRQHFGITFSEYLIQYRIRKAVELLSNPNARIVDVASISGFRDLSYFSRVFRKYMSMTPSEYRASSEASNADNRNDNLVA